MVICRTAVVTERSCPLNQTKPRDPQIRVILDPSTSLYTFYEDFRHVQTFKTTFLFFGLFREIQVNERKAEKPQTDVLVLGENWTSASLQSLTVKNQLPVCDHIRTGCGLTGPAAEHADVHLLLVPVL